MLKSMRSKIGNLFAKALMVVIMLSFVVWGIGDFVTGSFNADEVASVGEVKISAARVNREVQRQVAQIRQMFGNNLPENFMQAMNIEGNIIHQLVQEALLDQESRRLGIYVDDSVITDMIAQNPAFRNESGEFDRERFRAVLANAGETEQSYIKGIKQNLSTMALVQGMTAMPLLPRAKLAAIPAFDGQKRVAEYIYIAPSRARLEKAASEAELKAYYDANPGKFSTPEKRDVSFIAFTQEDVPSALDLTNEQLKAEYDRRIQEFTKGETREIAQMIFDDEAKAKEADELMKSGKSFADTARSMGFSEKQTHVGKVEKKELFDEVVDKVFTLPEGGSSEVIKSDAGYHIFFVKKIMPGAVTPFEEVKLQLREELQQSSSSEGLYQLANKVEDELAAGAKLEEVAKKMDLKLQQVKALGRTSLGKELPDGPDFVQQAYSADAGNESGLVLSKDQATYYVMRVNAVTPEQVKPFAEVRKEVNAAYLEEQSAAALKKLAESLAERQMKGESLLKLAVSERLDLKKSDPLYRGSVGVEDKFLPEEFVRQLFQVNKGPVPGAYPSTEGGYVVGRLDSVEAAQPLDKKQEAQMRQQLEEGFLDELFTQYANYLQQRYPVHIRKKPETPAAP